MTMLIPPLFLLSLALAQPVSAAPRNGGTPVAAPWGSAATAAPDGGFAGSEVVFGECTGSACSAGGGPARVPDPLRAAPLVVNISPGTPDVNVAPDAARVNLAPGTLGVDIARGGSTGSASSLPRVFSDLLSRLLDLVQQAPLPLQR